VFQKSEFLRLSKLLYGLADDVRILLYIRRQDELHVSYYSTSLRAGNTKKFSFPKLNPARLPYYLDYSSIVKNWSEAFGADSLKVCLFDKHKFFDGSLIRDFMHAAQIEWSNAYTELLIKSNQSLSLEGQDLIRQINIMKADRKISPQLFHKVLKRIEMNHVGPGIPASRDDALLFYKNFLPGNEVLRSQYFPKLQELFNDNFSVYPMSRPFIDEHLTKKSLADLLLNAFEK
jgi:hypothetical protein